MTRRPAQPSSRYAELDALRGLAVLAMIVFHAAFDLTFLYGFDLPVFTPAGRLFARITASVFLFVSGISFVVSWERTPDDRRWNKARRRGALLFLGAMLISGVTWLFTPDMYIRFGILHLLAISAFLQPLFYPLRRLNILVGVCVLAAGVALRSVETSSLWFYPFGGAFRLPSLDYYPLLPWFGVVLIGMGVASLLYVPLRRPMFERLGTLAYPRFLLWSGRRALLLYFVHQPVLIVLCIISLGWPDMA